MFIENVGCLQYLQATLLIFLIFFLSICVLPSFDQKPFAWHIIPESKHYLVILLWENKFEGWVTLNLRNYQNYIIIWSKQAFIVFYQPLLAVIAVFLTSLHLGLQIVLAGTIPSCCPSQSHENPTSPLLAAKLFSWHARGSHLHE